MSFLKSYPIDFPGIYMDIPKLQSLSKGSDFQMSPAEHSTP